MKIFDIVTETKIDEFYRGDAQRYKISQERLQQLGLDTRNGWQPYGDDESPFEYNDQNLIGLFDTALDIFAEHQLGYTDAEQVTRFKQSAINFLGSPEGANNKRNINNLFQHMSQRANPPLKYNEALGQMLNLLYLVVQGASQASDDAEDAEQAANNPQPPIRSPGPDYTQRHPSLPPLDSEEGEEEN